MKTLYQAKEHIMRTIKFGVVFKEGQVVDMSYIAATTTEAGTKTTMLVSERVKLFDVLPRTLYIEHISTNLHITSVPIDNVISIFSVPIKTSNNVKRFISVCYVNWRNKRVVKEMAKQMYLLMKK